jgi:hypothetical protein
MAQLRPLQSEAGFSVAEETIIDSSRNVVKSNSIEIVNTTYPTASKKEYISYATANDINSTPTVSPSVLIPANNILFSNATLLLTWEGYPTAEYTVNTNSTLVQVNLTGHGLSAGDTITVVFDSQGSVNDGTYTVLEIVNSSTFTFNATEIFNPESPIVGGEIEITSYGRYWEYASELKTSILSDSSNNLTLSSWIKSTTKENIPPGHVWEVGPIVNNTSKEFSYSFSISSTGSLENYGSGVKAVIKIDNVLAERE